MDVKEFLVLKENAKLTHPFTFCVAKQVDVPTDMLIPEECLNCKHFILNGGICDPL